VHRRTVGICRLRVLRGDFFDEYDKVYLHRTSTHYLTVVSMVAGKPTAVFSLLRPMRSQLLRGAYTSPQVKIGPQ
jgi:hypothetical protein